MKVPWRVQKGVGAISMDPKACTTVAFWTGFKILDRYFTDFWRERIEVAVSLSPASTSKCSSVEVEGFSAYGFECKYLHIDICYCCKPTHHVNLLVCWMIGSMTFA